MATRSKLLVVSTGLFHRFVSGRPHVPHFCPHVPLTTIQQFSSDASSVDKKDVDDVGDVPPRWIVVMDLSSKVPEPVLTNTFIQTAATAFGSTNEQAKKMIYKMETKKYRGFHIYSSEDMAKKFVDIPGVYQVLKEFEAKKSETGSESKTESESQVPKE